MQISFSVDAKRICRALSIIAVSLFAFSLVVNVLDKLKDAGGDSGEVSEWALLFDANRESSIPTWYSSGLLFFAAMLFALIGAYKRAQRHRYIPHWLGLAAIFLYLSLDEAAAIHEKLSIPLQEALNVTGYLYFAWVIAALPLLALFGLVYLRFLFHLPARIRLLFIAAGVIYIGGALLIEAVSANQWYLNQGSNLVYSIIGNMEELCEMLGVITLIYALLLYIEQINMVMNAQIMGETPQASGLMLAGLRNAFRAGRARLDQLPKAPALIVFCGGLNLILVQWVLARELTALLRGTELVVLLVSLSYFAGLSLGYLISNWLRPRWLLPLGALTLLLHLTLPVWFRLLVAVLASMQAYALAFVVLPLLTPFVISAFYSLFLPRLADSGQMSLPPLYALELLGSACGVLTLVLFGILGVQPVYIIYSLSLGVILLALGLKARLWIPTGVVCAVWLSVLPAANAWSNAQGYQALQGLPAGTQTLFTGYSPYQKVDVLESPSGARYLYLDGLNHFGTNDGSRLNVIMGQIPASLLRPQNAVVFGAGSMEMAALIADQAGRVTTVEVDPLVVEVSRRYFLAYNRLDVLTNRQIVIDDAKHFVAQTGETFDFVATDLPAAYSIQTATLYSAPFFRAVADRMNLHGVFSVNLTSTFEPNDEISRRIAAGLLQTFDDVMVVTPASAGWSFAYASDDLPFNRLALEAALQASGETNFVIYETPAVRAFVGDALPITLDTMNVVFNVSLDWIRDRMSG